MSGMEEPVEVRCLGVQDDKVRNIEKRTTAEIFNDRRGVWERRILADYYDDCPVCGRLMRVLAIERTRWLTCCSKKCWKEFDKKAEELGELSEALEHFRKRGGKVMEIKEVTK